MTINRVTERSMSMTALANLQTNLQNLAATQSQLSTGKIINQPSDDPAGTAVDLATRSAITRQNQYARAAQDGLGLLGTAQNSLRDVITGLQSARTLLVQSQDGAADATSQQALAAQITALRQDLLTAANSTYNNQPIFAGTAGVTGAYSASGVYRGDSTVIQRQVSDSSTVSVTLPGTTVFGAAGNDVFALLTKAANDLTTNPSAVSGDMTKLDGFLTTAESAQSLLGANYNRAQAAQTQTTTQLTALGAQKSQVEDADMAQTTINLQLQQTAYQAALAATAKAITPTLLDFLK